MTRMRLKLPLKIWLMSCSFLYSDSWQVRLIGKFASVLLILRAGPYSCATLVIILRWTANSTTAVLIFYVLLTVHLGIIFVNNQLETHTSFSCMFISILYMFRAAMCPSSGELIYQCDIWYMSLCIDDCLVCRFGWTAVHPNLHTKRSSIQSDIYQMYWND